MDSEIKNLKHELLKITWYMRGGVTYQESLKITLRKIKLFYNLLQN